MTFPSRNRSSANTTASDWGLLHACPSLHSSSSWATPACWDQLVDNDQAGRRSELLYDTVATEHTALLPGSLRTATCNQASVTPMFEYFFLACKTGATECSDELIDCPSSADLSRHWWEGFAETLANSSRTSAANFTARMDAMEQRTVHTLVHVFEPGSTNNTGRPVSLLCLSRTKIDVTAPVAPQEVRDRIDHRLPPAPPPLAKISKFSNGRVGRQLSCEFG